MSAISTHSLTRRLTVYLQQYTDHWMISTHSLTRRLTNIPYTPKMLADISTHSLTRRLTGHDRISWDTWWNFNSQPHKEADGDSVTVLYVVNFISTHSLTRYIRYRLLFSLHYFNSQPHKEADKTCSRKPKNHFYFNSQPHKEADSFPTSLWCCINKVDTLFSKNSCIIKRIRRNSQCHVPNVNAP